jgi:hypothetical protein
MGLLSKAAFNEVSGSGESVLDGMGKALAERILALTREESTPETAVSLLKAYGSFRAGACLSLKKGLYTAYASVGISDIVAIPSELLVPLPSKSYYSVDYRPPRGMVPDTKFWAFPLEEISKTGAQPACILLLGADRNSFQPGPVAAVVKAAKPAFLPFAAAGTADISISRKLSEKLAVGFNKFGPIKGIVFQSAHAGEDPTENLGSMTSGFGYVFSLNGETCLVFFSSTLDAELLARHITGKIPGKILLLFKAADSSEALDALKPFL